MIGKVGEVAAGIALGVAGAASSITGEIVGIVNTGVNVVIAASGLEGELADEAAAELNETIESTKETIKYIAENPKEVGAAIVDGVVETAKGVARGEAGAIQRATATITDLAMPTPPAGALVKATKTGVKASVAAGSGTVEVAKRVRRAAGETRSKAEQVNRGNRKARGEVRQESRSGGGKRAPDSKGQKEPPR